MKVLSIFAHREDHVVCGWPILQDANIERHLICCTDDGIIPLKESCRIEGIQLESILGLPNGFFRNTAHAKYSLRVISKLLIETVEAVRLRIQPDCIFVHNPFGEYGHFDHRLVFEILYNHFKDIKFLITDLQARSSHTLYYNGLPHMFWALYEKVYKVVEPDIEFYKRNQKLYQGFNMWTSNPYLNLPNYPCRATLYEC